MLKYQPHADCPMDKIQHDNESLTFKAKNYIIKTMSPEKRPGKILIVDDDPDIRRMIGDCLNDIKYPDGQLLYAESAEEAGTKLEEELSLILLNIVLKAGGNGLSFLERLRTQEPPLKETPVVVVSAISDLSEIKRIEELGATFLPKPFDLIHLEQAVINHVR